MTFRVLLPGEKAPELSELSTAELLQLYEKHKTLMYQVAEVVASRITERFGPSPTDAQLESFD